MLYQNRFVDKTSNVKHSPPFCSNRGISCNLFIYLFNMFLEGGGLFIMFLEGGGGGGAFEEQNKQKIHLFIYIYLFTFIYLFIYLFIMFWRVREGMGLLKNKTSKKYIANELIYSGIVPSEYYV